MLVVGWLSGLGHDVYQEVDSHSGGPVADIVCRVGNFIWVIELKLSLGITVMRQACGWRRMANLVSVAVPSKSTSKNGLFAMEVLQNLGIGLLSAWPGEASEAVECVRELSRPKLIRGDFSSHWRLCPEQKNFAAAGNCSSKRFSPYQQTCDRVREHLRFKGPTQLRDLVKEINHHYSTNSSARISLAHWIRTGSVKGVMLDTNSEPHVCRLV